MRSRAAHVFGDHSLSSTTSTKTVMILRKAKAIHVDEPTDDDGANNGAGQRSVGRRRWPAVSRPPDLNLESPSWRAQCPWPFVSPPGGTTCGTPCPTRSASWASRGDGPCYNRWGASVRWGARVRCQNDNQAAFVKVECVYSRRPKCGIVGATGGRGPRHAPGGKGRVGRFPNGRSGGSSEGGQLDLGVALAVRGGLLDPKLNGPV